MIFQKYRAMAMGFTIGDEGSYDQERHVVKARSKFTFLKHLTLKILKSPSEPKRDPNVALFCHGSDLQFSKEGCAYLYL
jgi:hypothetical protein